MNELELRRMFKLALGEATPTDRLVERIEVAARAAGKRTGAHRIRVRVLLIAAIAAVALPTAVLAAPDLSIGRGGIPWPTPTSAQIVDQPSKAAMATWIATCDQSSDVFYQSFSAQIIARGLLCGHSMFVGTAPVCTVVTPDVEYICVLASSPRRHSHYELLGLVTELNVDLTVVGGCVSKSSTGQEWACVVGQAAADRGLVAKSRLGHRALPRTDG